MLLLYQGGRTPAVLGQSLLKISFLRYSHLLMRNLMQIMKMTLVLGFGDSRRLGKHLKFPLLNWLHQQIDSACLASWVSWKKISGRSRLAGSVGVINSKKETLNASYANQDHQFQKLRSFYNFSLKFCICRAQHQTFWFFQVVWPNMIQVRNLLFTQITLMLLIYSRPANRARIWNCDKNLP